MLLNEEIKKRADKVAEEIVLSNYLDLLATLETSQSKFFKEYLSEITWDLHGLRIDITYYNRRISYLKKRCDLVDIPLG